MRGYVGLRGRLSPVAEDVTAVKVRVFFTSRDPRLLHAHAHGNPHTQLRPPAGAGLLAHSRPSLSPPNTRAPPRQVDFERPVIKLLGLCLRIGPPSDVLLRTTYLDDRVRLGKGSRGSRFVFTRGGSSELEGAPLRCCLGVRSVFFFFTSPAGCTC